MAKGNISSLTSKTGAADSSADLNKGKSSSRIFYEAVVLDFIANPEVLDAEFIESLKTGENAVSNSGFLETMPRNSIIADVVSDQAAHSVGSRKVFYPFFSSHLSLPVKAGEQVWVIFPSGAPGAEGYWLTRTCGSSRVDDANYSFRARESLGIQATAETSAQAAQEGPPPDDFDPLGFPPGGGRDPAKNWIPSSTWPIDTKESSTSYNSQFTPEAVPRFSKRSPDLSLQGSNNTLICLGEDRGRTLESTDESSLETDSAVNGKGTIDIVAGRSVYSTSGETIFDAEGAVATEPWTSTLPSAVASNEWEYKEVDKTPAVTQNNPSGLNPLEGDPDFINDLSRVYVSMKTSGDSNLSLEYPNVASLEEVGQVSDSAYIVLKSNEVRIVGRKNDDQDINGSIRIVKEGEDGVDKAVIMMLPDGTIMIDGPRIVIGSGDELANGSGNQVFLGRDATESIVLGDKLKQKLDAFLDQYIAHTHGTGVGPTSPPVTAAQTAADPKATLFEILSKNGKTK